MLDVPEGKNDGCVAGVRYFSCESNFGLFVKRAQVKLDKVAESAGAKEPKVSVGAVSSAMDAADRLAAMRKRRQASEAAGQEDATNPGAVEDAPTGAGAVADAKVANSAQR